MSGQLHAPVALPQIKETPVLIGHEAGWAPECGEEKCGPCRESNPGRQAPSPSLYRLSYPGSELITQRDSFFFYTSTGLINGSAEEIASL
jgi:hypothetical protein